VQTGGLLDSLWIYFQSVSSMNSLRDYVPRFDSEVLEGYRSRSERFPNLLTISRFQSEIFWSL
jgi:hypothetical protein